MDLGEKNHTVKGRLVPGLVRMHMETQRVCNSLRHCRAPCPAMRSSRGQALLLDTSRSHWDPAVGASPERQSVSSTSGPLSGRMGGRGGPLFLWPQRRAEPFPSC